MPGKTKSRPTFTAKAVKRILASVRVGASERESASHAGVSRGSLRHWLRVGEREVTRWTRWDNARLEAEYAGEPFDEPEPRVTGFGAFWSQYEDAKAAANLAPLRYLHRQASTSDVGAAKWFLARRDPERWGEARAAGDHGPGAASARDTVSKMLTKMRSKPERTEEPGGDG